MIRLTKIGKNKFLLPKTGNMRVDAVVYLSEKLFRDFQEGEALEQLKNAATLPGVYGEVIGMPDIHSGFGLPIGGVMATRVEDGVISAGGVGMDINCGVRLLSTSIPADELDKRFLRKLMDAIEDRIPTGIGKGSRHGNLYKSHFKEIVQRGAIKLIEMGYGREEDLECIEENGCLDGADIAAVSDEAVSRGNQLATLGGGNHFIDLGVVEDIYNEKLAEVFGLKKGTLSIMIHTGSRGFGHQICTDYTRIMVNAAPRYGIDLPDKGLACVPISSAEGRRYYKAMCCGVNFAFANRQLITYDVREAFREVFNRDDDELGLDLVYDVAHNIAKFETHFGRRLLIHRKGATRALPPGHPSNPKKYMETGHPAIIPGSMGTASYVVVGTELARETFFSINHGAGRVLSRGAARKEISQQEFESAMADILYNTRNYKKVLDEAPQAYKDIDEVVNTLSEIGITRKIAKLRPLGVIKGEGD